MENEIFSLIQKQFYYNNFNMILHRGLDTLTELLRRAFHGARCAVKIVEGSIFLRDFEGTHFYGFVIFLENHIFVGDSI